MWGGVLSFVRQGLRRRSRRRTARVLDESAALGDYTAAGGYDDVAAPREVPGAPLARAALAMAHGAVGLDDGEGGGGAEEAWAAASGWRAADEVRHLMAARESLRYVIYA